MKGNRLAGRRALVTGGARAIRASIARALAGAGADVMFGNVLSDDLAAQTAAELAKPGGKTGSVQLDVTDAQWESAVSAAIAELGGFDILNNNAGIEITSLVVDLRAEDLRRMCDVNIVGVGVGVGMNHAVCNMRPGGASGQGGAVLNVPSVAATIAFPTIAGYSSIKPAVDRLTRVAAMEAGKLGYGIRVNRVYPGLTPTKMGMKLAGDIVSNGLAADIDAVVATVVDQTPLDGLTNVEDVADAAAFPCSDDARSITGAGAPLDGGMGI